MPATTSNTAPSTQTILSTLIIGGGFGGIGMAIRLKQAGVHDFVLLEKSSDVGGCWHDNTYPGAACDVPSHLYSYSFEPKPDWSRAFAPQAEIHAYLHRCVEKYHVGPHVRCQAEVATLRYLADQAVWEATTKTGQRLLARTVVTACGQLNQPLTPQVDGLADFAGPQFHSARWDHGVDLRGKTVAVIGTGASAIQFVPQIAQVAGQVQVFQRNAPYLLPKPDRAYPAWEKSLYAALPWLQKLSRGWTYCTYELRALGFTQFPWLMGLFKTQSLRYLRREISDPQLRAKLTPNYPMGCKRILLSNDFYSAMRRPNVQLITDRIQRVEADGVRTIDGTLHRADVLIHGTGFAATEFLQPMQVTGAQGQDLNAVWRDGAQAYLGITVPGFPNLFMLYGPNTNLGHSSIVYMLESQISHVMQCLRTLRERGAASVSVKPSRAATFNTEVQGGISHTVWSAGCTSWYLNSAGRNTVNWPGFTFTYRRLTRHLDPADYDWQMPPRPAA
jgi:cyclohexanone monooxygenase